MKDRKNKISAYFKLRKKIIEYLQQNKYDIVHINSGSIPTELACLSAAKKVGVKAIAHSHSTQPKVLNGGIKKIIKDIFDPICRRYICNNSSLQFACSDAAGEYLFGKKAIIHKSYHKIMNAVNADLFRFDIVQREKIRKDYCLDNEVKVFGYVGRLSTDKNILFIIEAFYEIHKLNPKSILWLVGDGEEREAVVKKIHEYCLDSYVVLFGQRHDVPMLIQGFDCFIMPSLDEGLSLVLIEAQAAGLQVFAFDSLSIEHAITELLHFIPYGSTAEEYAKCVINIIDHMPDRKDMYNKIVQQGYEIKSAVKELENLYKSIL